jgi:hypothetical protein
MRPWGFRRLVCELKQRQIAQLETAVKVALRDNTNVLYHGIRSAFGLKSQKLVDFAKKKA